MTNFQFQPDLNFALACDQQDSLAPFRQQFVITDPDLIYLDGNSLGRLPKQTAVLMQDLVNQQWGDRLIRGWNEGWLELQERIGAKIARLLGADPDEIIIADSTSINLFKLALTAVQHNHPRRKIVTDDLNFPSDLYIFQGVANLAKQPIELQIVPSDGIYGPIEALAQAIDQQTALVSLSHTVFKSAYTYDMTAVSQLAADAGALILWDLSHSAGSVPINLHQANAPLAVGCTYKYLNGGPGSPAFLYIRRDWQSKLHNAISGWMGQRHMFDFALTYQRDPGLRHFLTGTPALLSTAAIEPGVDLLLAAGMDNLRAKSVHQTEYLLYLWQQWLQPLGFRLNSPPEANWRGSHVSLGHDEGWRIDQALIHQMNVIPDFRQPDNIRLGIAPLYTSYHDIYQAMQRLQQIVINRLYEKHDTASTAVT